MANSLLINLIIDGIVLGCIYALLAVGFSLLWWISGIVHIAHGAVMLVAGYALYAVFQMMGFGLPIALICGFGAAVAVGAFAEASMYRPLLNRGTDEMGILTASLGALIFLEYAVTIGFGPEGVTLDADVLRTPVAKGLPMVMDRFAVVVSLVTGSVFVGLWLLINKTQLGRGMRAMASNAELASILGINARRVNLYTAVIAAALCLPPAAFLLLSGGLVPAEALHMVLVASVVAIFGGRGSLLGALVAGVIIGIIESAMTWHFAAGWRQLITFLLLYLLLLVRPQGLFGEPG